jgi:CRP/FNR family transcriptional regulator, cyclic AMP receptor protein
VEVLRNTPPFSVLEEASIAAMAPHLVEARFRKGDVVYREGEPADRLFIVRLGQVKLSRVHPSGRQQLIGIVGPNQAFGEPGIIDHGPRAMDALAMDHCDLLAMPAGVFWGAVQDHPVLARRVIEVLGERLRRSGREVEDLIFFDAPTRLARKLLALAEDHGEPREGRIEVTVRMTQGELAQMLGMSRPNVNRLLAEFESLGWIDWNDGRPVLVRPDLMIRAVG